MREREEKKEERERRKEERKRKRKIHMPLMYTHLFFKKRRWLSSPQGSLEDAECALFKKRKKENQAGLLVLSGPGCVCKTRFLVLMVTNVSEYSKSTGSNLFCVMAVFISFPLARCAPPPHPAPLLEGREVTKKENRQ
jgi:hypothetical protein